MPKKIGTIVVIIVFALLIASPILTGIRQEPTLAVTIRTWSMTPLLTRGDMVFILPVADPANLSVGDIVVFRAQDDGVRDWTMHRIIDGDSEAGFLTKGDANERIDQDSPGFPAIRGEWVKGVVPQAGNVPLKIPLLGYLPLWLEENIESPVLIPSLLGGLAVILLLDELTKSKKRRKKEALQKHHLYFMGAIAFAIMMGAVMIMGSLFITIPYGVSESRGAVTGSDVGVLEKGTVIELDLANLQNPGRIPTLYTALSYDPQVKLDSSSYHLRQGDEVAVTGTLYANEEGMYRSSVIVGMFLPFLPASVISYLVSYNIWLAFAAISFIPALPLFSIPFLDSRFRRRIYRGWRKKIGKISGLF